MEGILHGVVSWVISTWPWLLGIASFYVTGAWVAAYWTGRKRISPGKKGTQYEKAEEAEWGIYVAFWPIIILWHVGIWVLMIPVAPFLGVYKFIVWGHSLGESRAKPLEVERAVEGEVILKPVNPYVPGTAPWRAFERDRSFGDSRR